MIWLALIDQKPEGIWLVVIILIDMSGVPYCCYGNNLPLLEGDCILMSYEVEADCLIQFAMVPM